MTEGLDPLAADEVLRRAAEISAAATPDGRDARFDRRSLTEAASEVGIERHAVELALAEHDAGLLRTERARGGLLGSSRVVEARVVGCGVDDARMQVIHWLRSQLLSRDEKRGSAQVWRPRDDLAAKVRRRVDAKVNRRVRLTDLDAVEVSTAEAGTGRTLVRLEAAFDDMRRGLRTGVVVIPTAVTPVLGGLASMVVGDPLPLLASIPAAGALGATGAYAGRRTLGDRREEARRAMRRFLDDLEDASGR